MVEYPYCGGRRQTIYRYILARELTLAGHLSSQEYNVIVSVVGYRYLHNTRI